MGIFERARSTVRGFISGEAVATHVDAVPEDRREILNLNQLVWLTENNPAIAQLLRQYYEALGNIGREDFYVTLGNRTIEDSPVPADRAIQLRQVVLDELEQKYGVYLGAGHDSGIFTSWSPDLVYDDTADRVFDAHNMGVRPDTNAAEAAYMVESPDGQQPSR